MKLSRKILALAAIVLITVVALAFSEGAIDSEGSHASGWIAVAQAMNLFWFVAGIGWLAWHGTKKSE